MPIRPRTIEEGLRPTKFIGQGGTMRRRVITYGMGIAILVLLIVILFLSLGNTSMNIGILVEHDQHHTHKHGHSHCDDGNPCTHDRHQDDWCEYKPLEPGHSCNTACCATIPEEVDADNECRVVPNSCPACMECHCWECAGTCVDGFDTDGLDCPNITINGTSAEPGENPDRDCDNNACIYSIRFDTSEDPNFNDIDLPCHKDHPLFINTCKNLLNDTEDIVNENCLETVPICGEVTPPQSNLTNLGNSRLEACVYYFSCSFAEFVPFQIII